MDTSKWFARALSVGGDAELVALGVGEGCPAHAPFVHVMHQGGAEPDQPRNFGFSIIRLQIQMHAVLRFLAFPVSVVVEDRPADFCSKLVIMAYSPDPPMAASERETLRGWLDYHRSTLAWKCDGLNDDELRRKSMPPSTLSLLGLIRHMAEVERHWFRRVIAGETISHVWSERWDFQAA